MPEEEPLTTEDWIKKLSRQADENRLYRYKLYKQVDLEKKDRILDVGCGTGAVTLDIARLTKGEVVGIDIDVDKLMEMCTWYDAENEDVKSAYKLPHHRASDLKAVWRGVAAAMGALLGARGGVDIPDGDFRNLPLDPGTGNVILETTCGAAACATGPHTVNLATSSTVQRLAVSCP